MYLSYDEFKDYSDLELTEEVFNALIKKAQLVLDNHTQNFYKYNDIQEDPFELRKEGFLNALVAQVEFFNNLDSTNFNDINSIPHSFSVGRTSINNNDGRRLDDGGKVTFISEEAYMYLEGTGLLYRGV